MWCQHPISLGTERKEGETQLAFLSFCFLTVWHELPGLSWIEVTETRSPSEPTPFKLFLSGVITVMKCDPSLPMITEVGILTWGAEISYYLDHPVLHLAFIQRPGIWKGRGTRWPICALLCLQWATKGECCNQLRMNPPMLLSGWASQVTQVPWVLRTFWLCFYTIQPGWPRATVSTEKGGPARGWSGGTQNAKQAM